MQPDDLEILAIFAHPLKTENLHQTLARRGLQRQLIAEND